LNLPIFIASVTTENKIEMRNLS